MPEDDSLLARTVGFQLIGRRLRQYAGSDFRPGYPDFAAAPVNAGSSATPGQCDPNHIRVEIKKVYDLMHVWSL